LGTNSKNTIVSAVDHTVNTCTCILAKEYQIIRFEIPHYPTNPNYWQDIFIQIIDSKLEAKINVAHNYSTAGPPSTTSFI
jgi:hypothetical protein